MNRFKYRNGWLVVGVMAFLPFIARGQMQPGSVTMKASVSEIVAISLGPTSPQQNLGIQTQVDQKTLTLTLSGSATDVVEIRLPVLIRSNTGYDLSALVRSQAATLANFVVLDVRPVGRLVATDAVANLRVASEFDHRDSKGVVQTTALDSLSLPLSTPQSILSGPRVSLGGTLNSADNALEVIILIAVKPDNGATNWLLSLSLSGLAGNRF